MQKSRQVSSAFGNGSCLIEAQRYLILGERGKLFANNEGATARDAATRRPEHEIAGQVDEDGRDLSFTVSLPYFH